MRPLELGLATPTLRCGHLSGPSRRRGGFLDSEVGGHDGAYKGRVHVIDPFVGRTKGNSIDRQQSYNVLVLRVPGLEEGVMFGGKALHTPTEEGRWGGVTGRGGLSSAAIRTRSSPGSLRPLVRSRDAPHSPPQPPTPQPQRRPHARRDLPSGPQGVRPRTWPMAGTGTFIWMRGASQANVPSKAQLDTRYAKMYLPVGP